MGGASSKSSISQEVDTLVVNKNEVNVLNEQLNTVQVNTIMKEAQTCSASITQDQLVKSKGLKSAGKLTINISQLQHSDLSFSCVNATKVRNEIANQMASNIMQNLETSTSTDILNKMGSLAASKSESGSLALPWGGSDTQNNLSQIVKSTNVTDNKKNISAIVKNAIENTFTVDNVKKCISMAGQAQAVVFEDTRGEEIDFIVNQQQAASLITQCVNNNDVSQNLTTGLMQVFDIKAKDTSTVKTETAMEATSEASSKRKGLIEETGDALSNLIKAPFEAIGGAFSGMGTIGKVISFILVCICCILVFGGIGYFVYNKFFSGDSGDTGESGETGDVGQTGEQTGQGLFGMMYSPTSASI
jgi:hypothetical protein